MSVRGNFTIENKQYTQQQSQFNILNQSQQGQFTQLDGNNQLIPDPQILQNSYTQNPLINQMPNGQSQINNYGQSSTQVSATHGQSGFILSFKGNPVFGQLQTKFWIESKQLQKTQQAIQSALKTLEHAQLIITLPKQDDDELIFELSGHVKVRKNSFIDQLNSRRYKTLIQLSLKQKGVEIPSDVFKYNEEAFSSILSKSFFANMMSFAKGIKKVDSLHLEFRRRGNNKIFCVSFRQKDGHKGAAETPSANVNIERWLIEETIFTNVEIQIKQKTAELIAKNLEALNSRVTKIALEPEQRIIIKANVWKADKKVASFLYIISAYKDLNEEDIDDDI